MALAFIHIYLFLFNGPPKDILLSNPLILTQMNNGMALASVFLFMRGFEWAGHPGERKMEYEGHLWTFIPHIFPLVNEKGVGPNYSHLAIFPLNFVEVFCLLQ
jgi:hypothetical protein